MSRLNVKKLPTACFSEGKLRHFEVVNYGLHKTTLMTCPAARLVNK